MKKILTPSQQADNREMRRSILENIQTFNGHSPRASKKIKIENMDDFSLYLSKGVAKIKFPVDSSNAMYQSQGEISEQGVLTLSIFLKTERPVIEGKSRKKVAIGLEDLLSRRRCHSVQTLTIVNSLSKHGDIYNTNVQHYERLKRLPTREELQEIMPTIKKYLVFAE